MMISKNYCTAIHDSTGQGVHNIVTYNIISHIFQLSFFFQDITLVCWT